MRTPVPWTHIADRDSECRHLIRLDPQDPGAAEMIGKIIRPENAKVICEAVNSHEALYEALRAIMDFIESGELVRNTSGDGEPGWALKTIPLVRALAAANSLLAKAVKP